MQPNYLGIREQISPKVLSTYSPKEWVAEEKRDGCWVEVRTDSSGTITSLQGRSGTFFNGDAIKGLKGLKTPWDNTILVGELETATEAATEVYKQVGFRRIWFFDVTQLLGQDVTFLTYEVRRQLLEVAITQFASDRLLLTRKVDLGFEAFFNEIVSNGGEGIVLKRQTSLYQSTGSNRTYHWVRCKPLRTVDYKVLGLGTAEKGTTVLRLGLSKADGTIEEVGRIIAPACVRNPQTLIGKIIECIGAEMHKSGILRHCRFNRVREDKRESDQVV